MNSVNLNPRITGITAYTVNYMKEIFGKTFHNDTYILETLEKVDYRCHVSCRKSHILSINNEKCLKFAKKYINEPSEFLKILLLSNRNKFCTFSIKGLQLVWRNQGTIYGKQNLVCIVKHGWGGIMASFTAVNGGNILVFIESTMDHMNYLNVLKDYLKHSTQHLSFKANQFCFRL